MRKGRWIAVLSVVLAAAAAFGGLYGMERLLEEKKHSLLSISGTVAAAYPDAFRNASGEDAYRYAGTEESALSRDALVDILEHMHLYSWEYLHEPAEGQLSMEQAMDRGKAWLDELSSLYRGSYETSGAYMRIQASLSTGGYDGETDMETDPAYSCWRLSFTGNDMEAVLTLNSVTGQVLDAAISYFSPESSVAAGREKQLLEWYSSSFGLEPEPAEAWGNGLRCPPGPAGLYAAAEISESQIVYKADNDRGGQRYVHLHLYLDVESAGAQASAEADDEAAQISGSSHSDNLQK